MKVIEKQHLFAAIARSSKPVLVLVLAETCSQFKGQFTDSIEQGVKLRLTDVELVEVCYPEKEMEFPRFHAPALYYFLPNTRNPAFWRGADAIYRLNEDIDAILKMQQGQTIEEARYTPEVQTLVNNTDAMLSTEEVSKFPSAFQMARGFAKELWATGKRAASSLPVLVTADQAFERMETCRGCDQFESESSRCKQCGCAMKVKSHLASATCPLSKWKS